MNAFEQLTIGTASKPLTADVYSKNGGLEKCNRATITVEGGSIRYRVDGADPTGSVGLLANPNDVITLEGRAELVLFRAIRAGTMNATINVDYGNMRLP